MWVIPDTAGITPCYEQLDINEQLQQGGWTTLASGMPKHSNLRAIGIRQKRAALDVACIRPAETLLITTLPLRSSLRRARRSRDGRSQLCAVTGDAAGLTAPNVSGSQQVRRAPRSSCGR